MKTQTHWSHQILLKSSIMNLSNNHKVFLWCEMRIQPRPLSETSRRIWLLFFFDERKLNKDVQSLSKTFINILFASRKFQGFFFKHFNSCVCEDNSVWLLSVYFEALKKLFFSLGVIITGAPSSPKHNTSTTNHQPNCLIVPLERWPTAKKATTKARCIKTRKL